MRVAAVFENYKPERFSSTGRMVDRTASSRSQRVQNTSRSAAVACVIDGTSTELSHAADACRDLEMSEDETTGPCSSGSTASHRNDPSPCPLSPDHTLQALRSDQCGVHCGSPVNRPCTMPISYASQQPNAILIMPEASLSPVVNREDSLSL